VAVVGTFIFIGTPYLLSALIEWFFHWKFGATWHASAFVAPGYFGILTTVLMAAVFGGMAFAVERRERWADFLAMFPVSRSQIVLSKLVVSVAFLGFTSTVVYWLCLVAQYLAHPFPQFLGPDAIAEFASCMLMSFGVAWLCSSFLSSPAIAACTSIALLVLVTLSAEAFDHKYVHIAELAIPAVTGSVSFVAGTAYYLRRVPP